MSVTTTNDNSVEPAIAQNCLDLGDGDPTRARAAFNRLLASGRAAVPALADALASGNAATRSGTPRSGARLRPTRGPHARAAALSGSRPPRRRRGPREEFFEDRDFPKYVRPILPEDNPSRQLAGEAVVAPAELGMASPL